MTDMRWNRLMCSDVKNLAKGGEVLAVDDDNGWNMEMLG